jgi:hypothetical protein
MHFHRLDVVVVHGVGLVRDAPHEAGLVIDQRWLSPASPTVAVNHHEVGRGDLIEVRGVAAHQSRRDVPFEGKHFFSGCCLRRGRNQWGGQPAQRRASSVWRLRPGLRRAGEHARNGNEQEIPPAGSHISGRRSAGAISPRRRRLRPPDQRGPKRA